VADDFSGRYAGLLTGSYDCVDRIVLNAYFSLGHNPGGFRCWWRRLNGGDDQLDDTHLMRMAGRFARRLKAWVTANGVPVIYCTAGQRKHEIAEEYLQTHSPGVGVFLILAAKAPVSVWKVNRSPGGAITSLEKKTEYVCHYSPIPALMACRLAHSCPLTQIFTGYGKQVQILMKPGPNPASQT
jgi:hypothetical protein